MSDHTKLGDPSPWSPITDPVTLKVLGKLGEEVNELGKAICRTVIQGVDECDPESGKTNRLSMLEEIADVDAGTRLLLQHLCVTEEETLMMQAREARKVGHLRAWHAMAGGPPRAWEWEESSPMTSQTWKRVVSLKLPLAPESPYIRNLKPLR